MRKFLIPAALAALALAAGYATLGLRGSAPPPAAPLAAGDPIVAVQPALLTGSAILGERAFDTKCASCHGARGAGKAGIAPPLVHVIYEPNHHGNPSFHRAVANGVQAHHWPFGDMPPVPGLTRADVDGIIAYIRALQRANGIFRARGGLRRSSAAAAGRHAGKSSLPRRAETSRRAMT